MGDAAVGAWVRTASEARRRAEGLLGLCWRSGRARSLIAARGRRQSGSISPSSRRKSPNAGAPPSSAPTRHLCSLPLASITLWTVPPISLGLLQLFSDSGSTYQPPPVQAPTRFAIRDPFWKKRIWIGSTRTIERQNQRNQPTKPRRFYPLNDPPTSTKCPSSVRPHALFLCAPRLGRRVAFRGKTT